MRLHQQHLRTSRAAADTTRSNRAVAQRVPLKLDAGTYYAATHPTGTIVESDELSSSARTKASSDLAGNAVLLGQVRAGWRAAAGHVDPVVSALGGKKGWDAGKKAEATRLYTASQQAGGTLKALLDAQQEWQDFLVGECVSMELVLSHHRSFGLEYEFATWEMIDDRQEAVKSHTKLGESEPLSGLFGVPFVLETDAQQELELVGAPLLAGQTDGGINKAFIKAAHDRFVATLVAFRATNDNVRADLLPFDEEGMGQAWVHQPAARQVQIATERNKWRDKPNQVGYQLNIALRPKEISDQIKAVGDVRLGDDHGTIYKKIRNRFVTDVAYTGLSAERRRAVEPSILVLSKGLANAIAIPTLKLVAQTHKPWARGDLHSYVKDLHGIWIKDSVPNITIAALEGSTQAAADMAAIIDAVRADQDLIPRDVLTGVPDYQPQGAARSEETDRTQAAVDAPVRGGTTKLKQEASAEAAACLTEVRSRLNQYKPQPTQNAKPDFLGEAFGTGHGVRKDTYANIGKSSQGSMHLAEFRSNKTTDDFLG
jgi:hypothetical protein